MSESKVIKVYATLIQKSKDIKASYNDAMVSAKVEQEDLKKAIRTDEANVQTLYKSYVLGEITLEEYQVRLKVLQNKKEMLQFTEEKLKDIDELMKKELVEVVEEYRKHSGEYYKINSQNKAEAFSDIQKAKKKYLNAIHKAQLKTLETAKYSVLFGNLEVDAGIKQFNYQSREGEVPSILSNPIVSKKGADVSTEEVKEAYWG